MQTRKSTVVTGRMPDGQPAPQGYYPNAAKGGGLIFQSDHSVSSGVSGQTYDYIVKLVREYGTYPIRLGEFEEPL